MLHCSLSGQWVISYPVLECRVTPCNHWRGPLEAQNAVHMLYRARNYAKSRRLVITGTWEHDTFWHSVCCVRGRGYSTTSPHGGLASCLFAFKIALLGLMHSLPMPRTGQPSSVRLLRLRALRSLSGRGPCANSELTHGLTVSPGRPNALQPNANARALVRSSTANAGH